MDRLSLTFACGRYDRTEALRTGDVTIEGIDLKYVPIDAPREIFDRMVGGREFDLSELSSSEFISMTGRGNCPFVALPVFPSRAFRHGFIFINRHAGIRSPKDLEGKRIGLPLYTQTAAIWIRGHLMHQYGVELETVRWVQGAVEKAGRHGRPDVPPLLKPVNIETNERSCSLGDLLARGEIDALIGSRQPETLGHHPDVTRLFSNYRNVEREFYKQTRVFPIMHIVAIRRDVYEKNPWIAGNLYKGFADSKNWALARMRFSGSQCYMLPWQFADVDEINEVFGGDPWPYGIEPNRPTLEALLQYMVEQHFIAKPISPEELFLPLPGDMPS
jgi:4,5-dihydroxyphthalate decarboxylase